MSTNFHLNFPTIPIVTNSTILRLETDLERLMGKPFLLFFNSSNFFAKDSNSLQKSNLEEKKLFINRMKEKGYRRTKTNKSCCFISFFSANNIRFISRPCKVMQTTTNISHYTVIDLVYYD